MSGGKVLAPGIVLALSLGGCGSSTSSGGGTGTGGGPGTGGTGGTATGGQGSGGKNGFPVDAQTIVNAAGLEAAYVDLKTTP